MMLIEMAHLEVNLLNNNCDALLLPIERYPVFEMELGLTLELYEGMAAELNLKK